MYCREVDVELRAPAKLEFIRGITEFRMDLLIDRETDYCVSFKKVCHD